MSLTGQIALVTGGSRGIGRGIALQLGKNGATVYITGRPHMKSTGATTGNLPTLEETADDITARGGKGIAVYCDHSDMKQVKDLFERISNDNNGQLDILVNNAYSGVQTILEGVGKKFYEAEPEEWDEINNVGLRNHYFCSVFASRLMTSRRKGLIVNIGSAGGLKYLFNIPYGVGKCAIDRLSVDMALELKSSDVCVVSIWPGLVRTELIMEYTNEEHTEKDRQTASIFKNGETIEYPGMAIAHLAADRNKMKKSGRILLTADLGDEYGFTDIDGIRPSNIRSLSSILSQSGWTTVSNLIPQSIKVPGWILTASCSAL